MDKKDKILFDFQTTESIKGWQIINDGVMGGLSQSELILSVSNTAFFQGTVSLENNGGFSSAQTSPRKYDLHGFKGVLLRLKGDGKLYQFRLRMDNAYDGISYRHHFKTEVDKWVTLEIPFEACEPVFRGRVLGDVGPIDPKEIRQIGFLISDQQVGAFQLEIDWIKAY